jgi:hypothetical protein
VQNGSTIRVLSPTPQKLGVGYRNALLSRAGKAATSNIQIIHFPHTQIDTNLPAPEKSQGVSRASPTPTKPGTLEKFQGVSIPSLT